MPDVTITAEGVFPVKAGKKQGYIKDENGALYGAFPTVLNTIKRGARYTITYKVNEFNGEQYKVVEKAVLVAGSDTNTGGSGQTSVGYVPDREKQEHIFVCGAVNSILSNPSVDVTQIDTSWLAKITTAARAAYALAWSHKAADGNKNADMSDEIPF